MGSTGNWGEVGGVRGDGIKHKSKEISYEWHRGRREREESLMRSNGVRSGEEVWHCAVLSMFFLCFFGCARKEVFSLLFFCLIFIRSGIFNSMRRGVVLFLPSI